MVRFQAIESTNNEDQKSSISESSSDDEDAGCITWSRKETSNDKHLSSISGSTSELSSSDDSSSSSESSDNQNKATKKRIKTKPNDYEDTDEYVIFAENSTGPTKNETDKEVNVTKTSQINKSQTTLKRKLSENVEEVEEIHNRQFIYIQVNFGVK